MSKNKIKKTGKIDISDLEDLPEDHKFNTNASKLRLLAKLSNTL